MAIGRAMLDAVRPVRFWAEGLAYRRAACGRELRALHHCYKGKPLLVVGNGPSLNRTPLDEFVSVPSIGMNKINLLFPRVAWRPSIIVCSNSLVMRQNQEFFLETAIPTYVSWKGRWFMKRSNRSGVRYFYVRPEKHFSRDIEQGVGMGGTVTYVALQFAYYMGADPVVLFGVDHSFADKGPAHKVVRSRADDANHFDANYFGKGAFWQLPDLAESERAYERARDMFSADGRTVYDATIGGRLRIFPRVGLDDAKRLCGLDRSRRPEAQSMWG